MSMEASSMTEAARAREQGATGGPHFSFDDAPMSRTQVWVIVLAVLLAALDGYDALSMAFVAPVLSVEWALGKAAVGLLLSSSLMGMAAGALGLSPIADVIGRKPVVLIGVCLMAGGSLVSAFCHSVPELAICRGVTGLGIGVMVALTTSIAAEFSNARNRSLAVAITSVGFAMGSVVGGLAAALLLQGAGWTWVFLVGAIVAAALFVAALLGLPESPAFIISRRAPNALKQLNGVLSRLGKSPLAALPPAPGARHSSYRALFAPGMAGTTLRLSAVFTLASLSAYFILSWLPQLIADAGFPSSTASMISASTSLVGIAGALILGMLARRAGPARVAAGALVGLGVAVVAFGFTPPAFWLIVASTAVCGFFLAGGTALFAATMAAAFPPLIRVSGVGFVTGFGRVLSAIGPLLAGWLFAAGLSRGEVSIVFAAGTVLGGLLLATSPRLSRAT